MSLTFVGIIVVVGREPGSGAAVGHDTRGVVVSDASVINADRKLRRRNLTQLQRKVVARVATAFKP